jgi:Ca2+-binding RTX toxin-like protein
MPRILYYQIGFVTLHQETPGGFIPGGNIGNPLLKIGSLETSARKYGIIFGNHDPDGRGDFHDYPQFTILGATWTKPADFGARNTFQGEIGTESYAKWGVLTVPDDVDITPRDYPVGSDTFPFPPLDGTPGVNPDGLYRPWTYVTTTGTQATTGLVDYNPETGIWAGVGLPSFKEVAAATAMSVLGNAARALGGIGVNQRLENVAMVEQYLRQTMSEGLDVVAMSAGNWRNGQYSSAEIEARIDQYLGSADSRLRDLVIDHYFFPGNPAAEKQIDNILKGLRIIIEFAEKTEGGSTIRRGNLPAEVTIEARNVEENEATSPYIGSWRNEVLIDGHGSSFISGGGGRDVILAGAGDDIVVASADVDILYGGLGNDILMLSGATEGMAVNLASRTGSGGVIAGDLFRGFEGVIGGNFNDTLTGSGGRNTLEGGDGADRLFGGGGNDSLYGGIGADTLRGGSGNDVYVIDALDNIAEVAGAGIDRVEASFSFTLGAEFENLTLTEGAPINGAGNGLANVLTGNEAANRLTGLGGNDTLDGGIDDLTDTLAGGAGNDTYILRSAGDRIIELVGEGSADTIRSGVSLTLAAGVEVERLTTLNTQWTVAQNLTGNAFAQVIVGNAGANRLDGGGGADTLNGGLGRDVLIGGLGVDRLAGGDSLRDQFLFRSIAEAGDIITDFDAADQIVLEGSAFGLGSFAGVLEASRFGVRDSGHAALTPGQRFIFDRATDQLWYDSNGSAAGGTQVMIADLARDFALRAGDILVI